MSDAKVLVLERLAEKGLVRIQPLFASVFGHGISTALLNWKYAEGRGESWVAHLVGEASPQVHCGVCFRELTIDGAMVRAAQLVDLMAAPKAMGLTRKGSPFARLLKHILERLPQQFDPTGIAFGFPSGRSMRLAEYCGVAVEVDRWLEMQLRPVRVSGAPSLREWGGGNGDIALLGLAWSRMRASLQGAVLGVRDEAYLRHRYLQHPEHAYLIMVVESAWLGRPIGIVVLRRHAQQYELLDLLAAWDDMPTMLMAVQNWLAQTGVDSAILCLTEGFSRQLAPFVSSVRSTEFRIMGNPFCSADTLHAISNRWWLTGGDTDYR
jgi:hypothetical protein